MMMFRRLLAHEGVGRKACSVHEQVAPETFVLNAFLDTCDLQVVGTALATCALVSPNLHLKVVQQSSHATLEGLREHHSVPATQSFTIDSVVQRALRRTSQ